MTWHTHNSEPSICSVEQAGASLPTFCLDTYLSELAKLNPIQGTSCLLDSETESYQPSLSGTTYALCKGNRGEDQLTFFAEDFRVKTLARQVREQELPEHVRDFGRNMRDSLTRCGLALSLPKTHLCFALGALGLSSKIWPRWGMMQDGELWELGTSARPINETGCGSWPTPRAGKTSDENEESWMKRQKAGKVATPPLTLAVKMKQWPTPCTRDYKGTNAPDGLIRKDGKSRMDQLPNAVVYGGTQTRQTGQLNPSWVEWLMGWPIGWTDLKQLATDKFQCARLSRSGFSQKDWLDKNLKMLETCGI